MPNPNQSNIPVSKTEREVLDRAKRAFESREGKADWGRFLTSVVSAYLISAGLMVVAQMLQNSAGSVWAVQCPMCQNRITGTATTRLSGERLFLCPYCGVEFIVRFT